MAPSRNDIIKVCEVLAQERNLKVSTTQSAKGALIAGAGAFTGGLLGGPLGLAVGGTVAACWSAYRSRGCYKSAVEVIAYDMTEEHKEQLASSVIRLLTCIEAQDVIAIITFLSTNASLKELIVKEMILFMSREMRLTVT